MKKKIFLIITVVALLLVVLAGCASTPAHKAFSETWGKYEQITYEVTRTLKNTDSNNKDNIIIKGVSTLTTERINNEDIEVGSIKLKDKFTGTIVTLETVLEDGSTMTAKVAFKTDFEPVASYKETNVKGYANNSPVKDTKQIIEMEYKDEKCYYKTNVDGKTTEDNIKTGKWVKSPFYDNLMLYHIARSSYKKAKKTNDYSFSAISAKVLSVNDFSMKNLSISSDLLNGTVKLFNPDNKNELDEDKGIKADVLKIVLQQKFPGSGAPMVVTLSREIKKYNDLDLTIDRVPLIIIEGDMTYKIKSYTTTKA